MDWKDGHISYPGMVKVPAIADGSCFFHAFVQSFYIPYKTQSYEGKPLNRREMIKSLRIDLSNKLAEKIDKTDPKGKTYYGVLSNGKLKELSKKFDSCKLKNMQKELASNSPVSNTYNEYLSMIFDKDIYLLNGKTKDVYMTGTDMDLLYKGRNSVVLLVTPGHYDTVGIKENGAVYTLFSPTHPFILQIKERMMQKTKK